jgi:hypothetical protein
MGSAEPEPDRNRSDLDEQAGKDRGFDLQPRRLSLDRSGWPASRVPAAGRSSDSNFPESGLFLEEPTISPDGRWLVYNKGGGGASLWMLTLGGGSSQ